MNPNDVPGFFEASSQYDNMHPDDYGREPEDDEEPEDGDEIAGGEDEE